MEKEIKLSSLFLTQDSLRHPEILTELLKLLEEHKIFSLEILDFPRLIELARFEDNRIYIRDGHHRCVTIFLSGREYLDPREYFIRDWKYSDWSKANLETGWCTPFDPRSHLRISDWTSFKNRLKEEVDKLKFIEENRSLYSKERRLFFLPELAERYGPL